jgi:hypothetical protein
VPRHIMTTTHHSFIATILAWARRANFRHAALAVAVALLLPPPTASAADQHGKRHAGHLWRGYGFLPGYRPPEQIELQGARAGRPGYWYGGPGFYHGRWNGGGFGPCWTPTPIGPHWNCG